MCIRDSTHLVRKEDRPILEGLEVNTDGEDDNAVDDPSAVERAKAKKKRSRNHVWVKDGDQLRAVEVYTGISDNKFTEMVEGDLKVGDKLVFALKPKK